MLSSTQVEEDIILKWRLSHLSLRVSNPNHPHQVACKGVDDTEGSSLPKP
jgi:hypothetical protein